MLLAYRLDAQLGLGSHDKSKPNSIDGQAKDLTSIASAGGIPDHPRGDWFPVYASVCEYAGVVQSILQQAGRFVL